MGPDQAQLDDGYVERIEACLRDGDWHGAHRWSKGWIGSGGGAGLVDPWLGYVAAHLLHGQPRTAVGTIDLALSTWVDRPADRAVLRWARGRVIRLHLRDPKTALADLDASAQDAPAWLHERVADELARCEQEAPASRKRKPSVPPAPALAVAPEVAASVTASLEARTAALPLDGAPPRMWDAILPFLDGLTGGSRPTDLRKDAQ